MGGELAEAGGQSLRAGAGFQDGGLGDALDPGETRRLDALSESRSSEGGSSGGLAERRLQREAQAG